MNPPKPQSAPSLKRISLERLHHLHGGVFYNPWVRNSTRSFLSLIKWRLSKNQYAEAKRFQATLPVLKPDFKALEASGRDYIVWLGHSTAYMKIAGRGIITDPIFNGIMGLWGRRTGAPASPDDLPGVDLVLISHNHHDHLDVGSLRLLAERFNPRFAAGLGHGRLLAKAGAKEQVELDWWDELRSEDATVRAIPCQHWSLRLGRRPDRMLWCGFAIRGPSSNVIIFGDSGYFEGLAEIGAELGPFDAALLPIGAYEPRWFMAEQHMSPAEAVRAALDFRAARLIPIHWGTFDLSDEPIDLPPKALRKAYQEIVEASAETALGLRLCVLDHGGAVVLGGDA